MQSAELWKEISGEVSQFIFNQLQSVSGQHAAFCQIQIYDEFEIWSRQRSKSDPRDEVKRNLILVEGSDDMKWK